MKPSLEAGKTFFGEGNSGACRVQRHCDAYYEKGEYDGSIADYTKAIAPKPVYANAYGGRGAAYMKKGDKEQAIADFRKALEIDPSHQQAKDSLKKLGVTP